LVAEQLHDAARLVSRFGGEGTVQEVKTCLIQKGFFVPDCGHDDNFPRTHIVIPEQLAEEIDTLVGKRGRSSLLTEAAWKEVRRLRMLKALEQASGAWKDKDHPELQAGASKYVEKIRKEDEKRFEQVTKR
jgi:Arc/MetJ-type ribon-helix-helix transcriptional regulator